MDRQFYLDHGWRFRRVVIGGKEIIEGAGFCPRCSGPLRIELMEEQPKSDTACTADGVRLTFELPIPPDLVDP